MTGTNLFLDAVPGKPAYTVNVTSTGSFGMNNHRVLEISVTGFANHPPVVDVSPDRIIPEGGHLTLNGTASDDDSEDTLTYLWSHDQPALNITLANPATLTPSFTAPEVAANTTITFTLTASDGAANTTYTIKYDVSDSSGNPATQQVRTVRVVDTAPPAITMSGSANMTIQVSSTYTEPGYTATDDYNGDITGNIVVTGTVDTSTIGTYTIRYDVADSSGNPATQQVRTVRVVDATSPVITLSGPASISMSFNTTYAEPGYTATDDYDGDITGSVRVSGTVDATVPDTYTLRYDVADSSGNAAETRIRTVTVDPRPAHQLHHPRPAHQLHHPRPAHQLHRPHLQLHRR